MKVSLEHQFEGKVKLTTFLRESAPSFLSRLNYVFRAIKHHHSSVIGKCLNKNLKVPGVLSRTAQFLLPNWSFLRYCMLNCAFISVYVSPQCATIIYCYYLIVRDSPTLHNAHVTFCICLETCLSNYPSI